MKTKISILLSLGLLLVLGFGCGTKVATQVMEGKNLKGVIVESQKFIEMNKRRSWEVQITNLGANDLHGCRISFNNGTFSASLADITVSSGLNKKKRGGSDLLKQDKIVIEQNSDFSQNENFKDQQGVILPFDVFPESVLVSCSEGSELWPL